MRFRLRTLLIVLAILPPVLAAGWWKYAAWRAKEEQRRALEEWVRYYDASQLRFFPTDRLGLANVPIQDPRAGADELWTMEPPARQQD